MVNIVKALDPSSSTGTWQAKASSYHLQLPTGLAMNHRKVHLGKHPRSPKIIQDPYSMSCFQAHRLCHITPGAIMIFGFRFKKIKEPNFD